MKLTDEQIIKALECCNSTAIGQCLKKCPYYNYAATCIKTLLNDALDLINRKDKRIAELQADNERLKHILVNFMAEIEDWEYKYNIDTSNIPKIAILGMEKEANIKAIRSNAIKEFADRLRKQATVDDDSTWWIANIDVDNLVKEMVGDTDAR